MAKRLLLFFLLSILLLGSLFAFKFYQIKQAASLHHPPPPAVVAVTTVSQNDWQTTLSGVGNLQAVAGVAVSNEIAGQVTAIHFKSGQRVDKGQRLVELDYETERVELKGLQAQLRLARIQFERSRKLVAGQFVPKSDYDQNQALLDEANAAVLAKQSIIEKKQIRAPFSGQIGIRQVNLGQYLSPGSVIATLQQLAPIYVDFELPEKYFSLLQLGQAVKVTTQAYSGTAFEGSISALSPLIEQNTRSVRIRATLPNNEQRLRPGMFAEVQILLNQNRQLLTLPDTAISYNPYGDFVFVIQSDEHGLSVQSRQIKTGIIRNGRVEIVQGLSAGERVVSSGQIKLRNGMPITIDKKPAPGERMEDVTP